MIKLTPANAAAKTGDSPGPWPRHSVESPAVRGSSADPMPAPGTDPTPNTVAGLGPSSDTLDLRLEVGVRGGVPNEHPALGRDLPGAQALLSSLARPARATVAGVYVHFPWCIKKCPYCDFLSVPSAQKDIPHAEYADAVIAEIAARRAELGEVQLRTVFFGGGTPSLWRAKQLGRVLAAIRSAFPREQTPLEVTVECNPGSLGPATARALLDVGVNRLSIGVQGLNDERLKFLGRWHDVERALEAVHAAIGSGMPRVSADLIYGVAGESPEEAANEVRTLGELGLGHVSAYALTIEPQTAFGALARKGRLPLAPEQSVADSFLAVDESLAALGFEHYETSNFARPGQRAQHNIGYWRGLDYVGLGCGAWGTVSRGGQRVRYRNRPQAQGYVSAALALRPGETDTCRALESDSEELSGEVLLSEALLLGLRLKEGVDVEEAEARTGARMWTPERERAARRLVERSRLVREGSRLMIPKSAWLFADGIIAELL